jgi:hypothetical protein
MYAHLKRWEGWLGLTPAQAQQQAQRGDTGAGGYSDNPYVPHSHLGPHTDSYT